MTQLAAVEEQMAFQVFGLFGHGRAVATCPKLACLTTRIKIHHMKRLLLLSLAVLAMIVAVGCKSSSGSREFIPGKGWVPND